MSKIIYSLLITQAFFLLPMQSQEVPPKKTICLNMIVKNEKDVITRCLQSVLPIIDTWVIVDTGSTDGTQTIIKEFLKEIPGTLYERPWVNFGHNRNEALELAKNKADYLLFMDADDTLSFSQDFKMPDLSLDFYASFSQGKEQKSLLPRLIKNSIGWKWYGAIHEHVVGDIETHGALLEGVEYIYRHDGARAKDPMTYQKDIALLQEEIKTDPNNPRHVFFLAKTYLMIGDLEKALEAFIQRSHMQGWDEEVFASKLEIGKIQNLLKKDSKTIKESFIQAYLAQPLRAEPIYYLIDKILEEGGYEKGYEIARTALDLPKKTKAVLFEDSWIYDYGIPCQYAFCAAKTGHYHEASAICTTFLERKDLPLPLRNKLEDCLKEIHQAIELQMQTILKNATSS